MLKKVICILLTVIVCLSFSVSAFAGDVEPYDGYILEIPEIEEIEIGREVNFNEGDSISLLATDTYTYKYIGVARYWGLIRYYDYHCYKETSANWYVLTGLNLTMPIYHKKDTGSKNLSFTIAQTYKSETANSFSVNTGAEAGIGDMIKASVGLGYGVTKTTGREYQISSSIQATIPQTSKTGYYKMHVCYNFYRMKIIRQRTDGTNKETRELAIPYGEPYAAVLYSASGDSGTWAKW